MFLLDTLPLLPRGLAIATGVAIAGVALSIYDVMGREAYSLFMQTSIVTVCAVVEAAALVTLRFRRVG
jgi:hypothetical protein